MPTIPRTRDINTIPGCTSDKFDEEYLRTVKGKGFNTGYFWYQDGPIKRYLLIWEKQPMAAAWDDGTDGGSTLLSEFFEPFLKSAQTLTFCDANAELIACMGVSWQQRTDANTSPGVIDAAEMVKSLLRRNREFIVRLRRDAHTTYLTIGSGRIHHFYFDTQCFVEGEAETKLVHELTANHAFLTIDVWEKQEASKSEDWALVPPDYAEGMIRFYSMSAPHLILLLGDKEIKRVALHKDTELNIGREPSNDIYIDNLSVSRSHAIASFVHAECRIEDQGSKNGTFFNGEKIEGTVILNDGEEVKIGKHTVRYVKRAVIKQKTVDMDMLDRTVVMTSPLQMQQPQDTPKVAILTFGGKLHQVRRAPFSIGADSESGLKIQEPGVKGVHAMLEKDTGGHWWISHRGGLLSSTRLNGTKIRTAQLNSGDLIQVGTAMLRFQLTDEPLR